MKHTYIYLSLYACLILVGCTTNQQEEKITNQQDYDLYLSNNTSKKHNYLVSELDFWTQKLKNTPNQYPYLAKIAGVETGLFSVTGNIESLIKAEKNLQKLNQKTNYKNASSLRSLARNFISQHRFQEALLLLEKAEVVGENLLGTQKMLFDVNLELGNYETAAEYLTKIQDFSDFDYLIRASKWNDHLGDLDNTIRLMEKAIKIAEADKNESLLVWSYTNIADFYGHNNQIKKSYEYYLKSLELDPSNAYAKKGIAWIVYSHEKNPKEALRIIDEIIKEHISPDYFLLKGEIEEYLGNHNKKSNNIEKYIQAVKNELYGDMYNHYNAQLYLDDLNKTKEAFQYIKKEIKNRHTPMSYDLLAWAYYKDGSYEKALEIAEKFVKAKTFEPLAMYHLAQIYKANNKVDKATILKKELLASAYELGPLLLDKIKKI